ncbi:cytidylate kinase-like family protein [Hominifimenecus microfluidus]|uniref:Cytidylate kinase-like family protein n=1 Tax=Hominifimenecus microfluidus TaxID=2885348 RepID=A0AAE3EB16_9FIRM|nr:cytidylate kinase-like family protein [Hominifimenecus microfluidus]MCC2231677.1 cytidylate kinase-like family protein [Hominifimenecus microfluidus]
MKRIITISREFGSGGRTIGKGVAEKLGIPCYDHEVIEQLVERSGFAADYVKSQSEYAPNGSLFVNALNAGNFHGLSNQDKLWTMQRQIIEELGEKENCVIVGRCADYILRDRADCLKVFIHRDFQSRAERIVQVYGETEVPTEKRLKEKDKRRAAYYQFYTDQKWADLANYHIVLDSGVIGIEKCIDIIADLY